MKIKGIHNVCGREFLVQQVLESQGHCPWDGEPFNNEYTALLAEALRKAELAGTMLEESLEAVADMAGDLSLVEESVLGPITAPLAQVRAPRPAGAR
ncbi:MAG: hypothetical protein LC722_01075 [Actinobacteria bacterium]|nr:hypothetical protein [Actinomycetota bacterium]